MIKLNLLNPIFKSQGIDSNLLDDNNILWDGMIITVNDQSIYGKDSSGNVFSQSYFHDDMNSFLNAWQTLQVTGVFKKPYIDIHTIEHAYYKAKIDYEETLKKKKL